MNRLLMLSLLLLAALFLPNRAPAQKRDTNRTPVQVLSSSLRKIVDMIEPPEGAPPTTFYFTLQVRKAEGIPKSLSDISAKVALQLPDRLWISADAGDKSYSACRNRQQLWIRSAAKHFGVLGEPGRPRFASSPNSIDDTTLPPLKLPLDRDKLLLLPFLMDIEDKGWIDYEDIRAHVLQTTIKKEAVDALRIPMLKLKLWLDTNDLPIRVGYIEDHDPKKDVQVLINNLRADNPWPDERWQIPSGHDEKIQKTSLSTLTRFIGAWLMNLEQKAKPLGKPGERKIVANEGQGRLEIIDGLRVMFLKGSPQEMGHQHGVLLRKQIEEAKDQVLYGIGVGSSFDNGAWFFDDLESAQKQMLPFMHPDYLAEMDALAGAARIDKIKIRFANYFPEMFHCSSFATWGKATATGKLYHGRVLDYLRGVGVEKNAVITVLQPEGRNAWVNVGYAGFVGSVTAMNDKQLAIGELGGYHDGEWEGKPMAELIREVMERADSAEEALDIMRRTTRTCDYSYLISDGKSHRAIAVRATGTKFDIIEPGKKHDRAPDPIADAVIIATDKRYEELVKRIKEKHGKITGQAAWDFMKKPVAMDSNIQTVLFMPETLEFWVANSDADRVASDCEHHLFNLGKLLEPPPSLQRSTAKVGK